MILVNQTRIPTKVLRNALTFAASSIKCNHKGIVARVSTGLYGSGMARFSPYAIVGKRLILTRGAWITIVAPLRRIQAGTHIDIARKIIKLAAHEFQHCIDREAKLPFDRNKRWEQRPQEKRAIAAEKRIVTLLESTDRGRKILEELSECVKTYGENQ